VKFVDFGGKRQNNEQCNYEQYIPKSFVKHHPSENIHRLISTAMNLMKTPIWNQTPKLVCLKRLSSCCTTTVEFISYVH
jgi:hypothetical protein